MLDNGYMEYEEEIDILDLLYKVLVHYKKIIVVAVLCAVLGAGYGLLKNHQEDKLVSAVVQNDSNLQDVYGGGVSFSSADLVAIDSYLNLLQDIDREKDYLANAPRFAKTENDTLYDYTANFKITNVTDVNGIIRYIQSNIFQDEVMNSLAEKNGLSTDSKYYSEKYFLKEAISLYNISDNEVAVGDVTASRIKTLVLNVSTESEELSQLIGEELKDIIMSYKPDITNEFNSYIFFVSETTDSRFAPELNTEKGERQAEISANYATAEKAFKGFSKVQLKYLAQLHPELEIEIGRGLSKPTLIGGVLGAFIVCAYYGLLYLLSGKLHTADELGMRGLKVYGKIVAKKYTGWVDKLFQKGHGEDFATVMEKINLDIRQYPGKEIILASTLKKDSAVENLANRLKEQLKAADVYYDIPNNAAYYNRCSGNVGVIYLEKIDGSKRKDIAELVANNKNLGISGLGVVAVE